MEVTTKKGLKGNPYEYLESYNMRVQGIWTGGWVITEVGNRYYCDSYGHEYKSEGDFWGGREFPYYDCVYRDMLNNHLWEGGWVAFLFDGVVYVDENSRHHHNNGECVYGLDYDPYENVNSGNEGGGNGNDSGNGSDSGNGGVPGNDGDEGNDEGNGSDEESGASVTDIHINAGSYPSTISVPDLGIELLLSFSWTSGDYNISSKSCSCNVTVTFLCHFGSTDLLITGFQGDAHFVSPMRIEYNISFSYSSTNNMGQTGNCSLSGALSDSGTGSMC